jgi:uncharacterized pyridoxamine 5'-phosphate oxidase family protein
MKSLTQFIKDNREELVATIRRACPNCRIDNSEIRLWILNDEGLYLWAKSEGVIV